MASSERLLGCVLAALLGGCTLLTNADDHRDGTGADMGERDAAVADAGDEGDLGAADLGGVDMRAPSDLGPGDMGAGCGVGNLNGGSLVAAGIDAYDVTDFTIETWFRPDAAALSGDQNLFGRWGVLRSTGSYALYLNDGRPALGISCDGADFHSYDSSARLTERVWVHIAATYDASSDRVQIFLDGTSIVDDVAACGPPHALGGAADLVLGYDDPMGGDPAQGLVDEARLSRVVRYGGAFMAPPFFESDPDTLALYHFEDAALPAADESMNANPMNRGAPPDDAAGLAADCRP